MTINTPNGGNDDLKSIMEGLSDEKRDELLEMLKQDKNEREKTNAESLYGNKEAILKDLKENYVKIETDKEMLGYKGNIVHIELPAIGGFEGFKFDYFVSYDEIIKEDFDDRHIYEKKSYSREDIAELLSELGLYMSELGVSIPFYEDKVHDLQYRKTGVTTDKEGDCLKKITGLDSQYFLKDTSGNSRFHLWCDDDKFCFGELESTKDRGFLLLKLFN